MNAVTGNGHSAVVQMELRINNRIAPIAQLGPNYIVLKNLFDHPPTDAEISLTIDSHTERWQVYLPDGLKAHQQKSLISRMPANNGSIILPTQM